jgi:hypothetical protein
VACGLDGGMQAKLRKIMEKTAIQDLVFFKLAVLEKVDKTPMIF